MTLEANIEAILFYKAQEVTIPELMRLCDASAEEIAEGLKNLAESLAGHGIILIQNESSVALTTAPSAALHIQKLTEEDESPAQMSNAALETLAIIIYQGPISQSGIDQIRGVRSHAASRNLLARGLIEKRKKENEAGAHTYGPSLALLSYLGISNITQLPDYEAIRTTVNENETL